MTEKFKVQYEVQDGYAGARRPQTFTTDDSWIEWNMSDEDLEFELAEVIQTDFENRISWTLSNRDEVLEWAKNKRDEMRGALG